MKTKLMTLFFVLTAGVSVQAQTLEVECGLLGALQCDGREIIVNLYNPACGTMIVSSSPLVVWTGDDYIVNLTTIFTGGVPSPYEIYSIEVRALGSCGLTPAPAPNPCGYVDGVTVGDPGCTAFNTTECFELSANCGPTGGVICMAGQVTNVVYTRNPGTGDVLLQID